MPSSRHASAFRVKEITPTQLAAWLADASREKPVLLDVREPWEYEKARIAGARLVPMREVPGRLDELDQSQDIVAICHHGGRSLQVAAFLEKNGYNKVHNLVGGVDGWSRTVDPAVPLY